MQLAERERAVTVEERQAGPAEALAAEGTGIGVEQLEGVLVMGGRTPAPVGGHDRPEQLAELVEASQRLGPLAGEGGELGVEAGESMEQAVPLDVERDALVRLESGRRPVRSETQPGEVVATGSVRAGRSGVVERAHGASSSGDGSVRGRRRHR